MLPATAALPAAPDPVFALIAAKRAADVAHGSAIDVQDAADAQYGHDAQQAWKADEACEEACHRAMDAPCQLARTAPTKLRGLSLCFCLQASNGLTPMQLWHRQLRATMAVALETIIRRSRRMRDNVSVCGRLNSVQSKRKASQSSRSLAGEMKPAEWLSGVRRPVVGSAQMVPAT
jgi:hypothetical protein